MRQDKPFKNTGHLPILNCEVGCTIIISRYHNDTYTDTPLTVWEFTAKEVYHSKFDLADQYLFRVKSLK